MASKAAAGAQGVSAGRFHPGERRPPKSKGNCAEKLYLTKVATQPYKGEWFTRITETWGVIGYLASVLAAALLAAHLRGRKADRDADMKVLGNLLGFIFNAYARLPLDAFETTSSFLKTFKIDTDSLRQRDVLTVLDELPRILEEHDIKKMRLDSGTFWQAVALHDKMFGEEDRGSIAAHIFHFGDGKNVLVGVDSKGRVFGGMNVAS